MHMAHQRFRGHTTRTKWPLVNNTEPPSLSLVAEGKRTTARAVTVSWVNCPQSSSELEVGRAVIVHFKPKSPNHMGLRHFSGSAADEQDTLQWDVFSSH